MSISCSFCIHVNPIGSKFCNECGSPLRLKPCGTCEAVNDLEATRCHQCGVELDAGSERAHEFVEVRRRESIEASDGADRPETKNAPRLLDQYFNAPQFDLGSLAKRADAAETAQPRPTDDGPTVTAFAAAAEASRASPEPLSSPQLPASFEWCAIPQSSSEPLPPLSFTPSPLCFTPTTSVPGQRRTMSPLLYMLGASLLVFGVIGYDHYQHRSPAPAERWPSALLGPFSDSSGASNLLTAASRSITRLVDGAAPSTQASGQPADKASIDAAQPATPASRAPFVTPVSADDPKSNAEFTPAPVADGERNIESTPPSAADTKPSVESTTAPSASVKAIESIPVPSQSAATTSATAAAQPVAASDEQSTSRTHPSEVDPPVDATADAQPARVAPASPKQVAHAAPKRSEPRRTTAIRPMTAAPAPLPAVDTNRTSASPLAPVCTKGVAALGLCDPNHQERN